MLLYLLYKVARGDILYWPRIEGAGGVILSFFARVILKVVVDFSGCVHFRHPFEMGGLAFSMSMIWAQIFSFVALIFFEDDDSKEEITIFLSCR